MLLCAFPTRKCFRFYIIYLIALRVDNRTQALNICTKLNKYVTCYIIYLIALRVDNRTQALNICTKLNKYVTCFSFPKISLLSF